MLMILGATFTGLAAWLILAEAGVRPTDGRWARGLHCVAGWLTLQGLLAPQGEFTFGVPQFSQLFHPILVCLAGGMALVAMRLVHGRGWTLGIVDGLVPGDARAACSTSAARRARRSTPASAASSSSSAVLVELVAAVLGTERRLRFAVASGLAVGTVGLAAEWAWNADAYQPWTSALLPEALVLGVLAAVGAAVLGAAFAAGITGEGDARSRPDRGRRAGRAWPASPSSCSRCAARPATSRPTIRLEPAGEGLATVVATLTPADAADDAYWFQVSAWQGGGLELADMEPTGAPGEWRSEEPVPIDGYWKTLLRLHRGAEMMAVPIYLPADTENDLEAIPAVDRQQRFESERTYLLRETREGNGWLSPLVHLGLVAVLAAWALAFVTAIRSRPEPTARPATKAPVHA